MTKLNKKFWDDKYANNKLGWDIGYISTPLKTYIDQLNTKNLKILIPGAGNGYEVEYLFNSGFTAVYVIDIAKQPLDNLKKRIPDFPEDHLLHINFFDLQESNFDLILEQTFFCALDPCLRKSYALKMHELLRTNGKLAGLFFDFPLTEKGPPFGGDMYEYKKLFDPYFKIRKLERAYNSIEPRHGNELFVIFEK
ncbi:MAG: methyltransferase domain-containing protein [Maribacter sp.]|nr:methyltransferase domain-containing protein [Maribacter sp.]NNK74760.1 methyltransferase domain-containing protein [Maribacter sp.]